MKLFVRHVKSSVAVAAGVALLFYLLCALARAAPVAGAVGPLAGVIERDWPQVYIAEGVVEAVRQTTVAAQVAGAIVALPVKAGDRVRAGDVLARIDQRTAEQQLAANTSQVRELEALAANARRKHERNRELAQKGFVSQAAIDQSESEQKAAEAQLAAARANADQARTAQTFTVVTAPYAAVVGSTEAQLGDMASPGRPLVTLFDPGELRVTATLPQAVLAKARIGEGVAIELPALSREATARNVVVVPLADRDTHTARVRLDLPRLDGILPGQYARARFVTGSLRALAVPARAVTRRGELTAVYVVDAQAQPQLRQVRLGERLGSGELGPMVQVLAGLRAGERVALDPVRAGTLTAIAP